MKQIIIVIAPYLGTVKVILEHLEKTKNILLKDVEIDADALLTEWKNLDMEKQRKAAFVTEKGKWELKTLGEDVSIPAVTDNKTIVWHLANVMNNL